MRRALLLLVILALAVGSFQLWRNWQYQKLIQQAVDPADEQRVVFEVQPGERVKKIAQRLEREGLVPADWAFYRYVKEFAKGQEIEAGRFLLQRTLTIPDIVEALTHSSVNEEMVLTVPEGLTINQIDDLLAEKGILPAGEFRHCALTCSFDHDFLASKPVNQSLEGYLFPDTYFVNQHTLTPENLVQRMLDTFDRRITKAMRDQTAERGLTLHQVITMASIVEREDNTTDNRPIVAGILWGRYEAGQGLAADATIRYITGDWTGALFNKDLQVDSPYNTRKYAGLPPGPIGNPGLESFQAALNPQESEYWYYLHGTDGQIHYGRNNEEHNENKRKYL